MSNEHVSETLYKIRSRTTKEFSTGGNDPSFSKKGKIWKRKSDLSNHFAQLSRNGRSIYQQHDIEVLTIVVREECIETSSGKDWLQAAIDRAQDREAKLRAYIEESRRKRELEELSRLQSKYPGVHK